MGVLASGEMSLLRSILGVVQAALNGKQACIVVGLLGNLVKNVGPVVLDGLVKGHAFEILRGGHVDEAEDNSTKPDGCGDDGVHSEGKNVESEIVCDGCAIGVSL